MFKLITILFTVTDALKAILWFKGTMTDAKHNGTFKWTTKQKRNFNYTATKQRPSSSYQKRQERS